MQKVDWNIGDSEKVYLSKEVFVSSYGAVRKFSRSHFREGLGCAEIKTHTKTIYIFTDLPVFRNRGQVSSPRQKIHRNRRMSVRAIAPIR